MVTSLIENDDAEDGLTVEGSRPGALTMQQFQQVYAVITGKNEEISKASNLPIMLKLDDLYQLDQKVRQMLEQYKVVGNNATYNVYYDNGEKSIHSSYEKFAQNVGASSSSTESIYFRYRISILLPQLNKPQNYTLSIRCINRHMLRKKLQRDLPMSAPPHIVNMIAAKTVDIKVEYIDFSVARAIMAAMDEWITSLQLGEESNFLKMFRARSHFIPPICQYVGLFFLSWGYFGLFPHLVGGISTLADFLSYLLAICLSFFITWKFLGFLGGIAERAIDSTCDISFLELTRGDKKEIDVAMKKTKTNIVGALISGACSGVAGVGVKYVAAIVFAIHG